MAIGDQIRQLKAAKADKAVVSEEVNLVLPLLLQQVSWPMA